MRKLPRVLLLLPLLALGSLVFLPPVRGAILALVALMRTGSVVAVTLYVLTYCVACLITAPVWLLSAVAGYAYGPVRGALIASPASVLAMTVTFATGRLVLRRALTRRAASNARWLAIDRAMAKDAFRIMLLLRVSPLMPQCLLSYSLSITRVTPRAFVAATWLGLLPITCLQVYAGSLVRDASELFHADRPPPGVWSWLLVTIALTVTAVAIGLVAHVAKRAIERAVA